MKYELPHNVKYYMVKYQCDNCDGSSLVIILKDTQKATEPKVEFCPFCGISVQNLKEIENEK